MVLVCCSIILFINAAATALKIDIVLNGVSHMKKYGYIRVSSHDQNEKRQMVAMQEVEVSADNIFVDKQSGKDFNRPMYKRMVNELTEGDLLYIKSIDRLGRNYNEMIEQWQYLTKEIGVDIVVLDMPLLDTRKGKDLIGTFLSDVVLQLLSFVAENERVNIKSRQREGIEVAKANGVKFGRPALPIPDNFKEICERMENGEITVAQAAAECGFSRTTFYVKRRSLGIEPKWKNK